MISKGLFNIAVCKWIEKQPETLKVHAITDKQIGELYEMAVSEGKHQHPGIE